MRIAVLAFDQISPFHLAVPSLVFEARDAHEEPDSPPFVLQVCAVDPDAQGRIRTTAGYAIQPEHGLEAAADAQVLVVPSWRSPEESAPDALCATVRAAHARGATVVGLCLGAFVLAQAGILDGRRATTHWLGTQAMARLHPAVRLEPDVLYVEEDQGRIVTSAGTAAGLDCCLHLLRRWHGAALANRVARRLVVSPHRLGGQAQFIEQPMHEDRGGDRLSELMAWVCAHLAQPHTLDSVAARAAMSRRQFSRRFREVSGTSFLDWLLTQRLGHAQRLLEAHTAVEAVATAAGFGSAVSLRQHFKRAFQLSPSAYRRMFTGAG